MTVSNGVANGVFRGFMVSVHEGNGWKAIVTILDAAAGFFNALFTDNSIISDMALDILLGLLFAGFSVFQTVLSAFKSTDKNANNLIQLQ